MTAPKSTRVTNVQVPGAPAPQPEQAPENVQLQASSEGAKQEVTESKQADDGAPGAAFDIDAIREQARNEARAELHAEIRAAQAVAGDPKAANAAGHTQRNYRDMHAADIDPATLTAPVLTRDGYLCPPAPEKK